MKVFRSVSILCVALSLCVLGCGVQQPLFPVHAETRTQLDILLAQLDAASAKFKNATASFEWQNYERVVRDTTIQTGTIYFERSGTSTQMGAAVSDAGVKAKPKIIEYKGGVLRMFDPGVNQITLVKAGSNQAQYEGFLTLGFGGSGKDLAAVWNITDQGAEMFSDGGKQVKTEKLDLVAKDPAARNTFTHVTIWVDPARGVSLKQVFYAPSGDTRTSLFSNIKLNGSVDHGPYKIPANVPTVTH